MEQEEKTIVHPVDCRICAEFDYVPWADYRIIKYKCVCCEQDIRSQTEKRYHDKGNYCEMCLSNINTSLLLRNAREKETGDAKEISRKIKEKQEIESYLRDSLNVKGLVESDEKIILGQLQIVYDEIKELRRSL